MNKPENVVWGIIGAGDVCEVKSAPAMQIIPNSRIKTVMRRNAEKAADYARRHKIQNWTTTLEDIFNDAEINAVYIATPPNSHAELTIKAAKAGKAVYVEKPMATTHAACLAMIEACEKANVPLFVAYYRRVLPGFLKVKELIESGEIGDVRLVTLEIFQALQSDIIAKSDQNWRVIPEISGGGYFHDLASHQLDFFDFLFGEIHEVTGSTANQVGAYPADDLVTANLKFKNGVIGSGVWCFNTDKVSEKDEIKIVGSAGELSFNTFGDPMIIRVKTKRKMEEFTFSHTQPIQQPLIELIVDEIRGIGKSPSTGITAARTNLILQKITSKNHQMN